MLVLDTLRDCKRGVGTNTSGRVPFSYMERHMDEKKGGAKRELPRWWRRGLSGGEGRRHGDVCSVRDPEQSGLSVTI